MHRALAAASASLAGGARRALAAGVLLLAGGAPLPAAGGTSIARIENARVLGANGLLTLSLANGRVVAIEKRQAVTAEAADTRSLDAAGGLVLPGFHDSHVHLLSGGESLVRLSLDGVASLAELGDRLRHYAAARPGDAWLLGRGWTFDIAPAGRPLDRHALDASVADRPVLLESYDGHALWANSRALALAGVGAETPDPEDGRIVREAGSREPSGLLLEGAMALVEDAVPQPSRAERLGSLRAALAHLSQLGVTGVDSFEHDASLFELLAELERRGELPLRLRVSLPIEGDLDGYVSLRQRFTSEWLSFGYVKGFVDGVIESQTAYLLAPYADGSTRRGEPRIPPERLEALVLAAQRRGLPVALHAIGDGAVRLALDTIERVQQSLPRPALHHRIEHIEVIDPADLPRFAALGVVASMQPFHANPFGEAPDEGIWSRQLGAARLPWSFAWRGLRRAGAPLVFGSDWPVMSADPLQGLAVALTRRDAQRRPAEGWNAHQTVDLETAISAYAGLDHSGGLPVGGGGTLRPDVPADLVVLAPEVDPGRPETLWSGARVRHVLVGGELRHSSRAVERAK